MTNRHGVGGLGHADPMGAHLGSRSVKILIKTKIILFTSRFGRSISN